MKIEVFLVPGCPQCANALGPLKSAAYAAVGALTWDEISVLEALNRAVELGVLTLPAIAIDGELVFSALPKPADFALEVIRRARKPT